MNESIAILSRFSQTSAPVQGAPSRDEPCQVCPRAAAYFVPWDTEIFSFQGSKSCRAGCKSRPDVLQKYIFKNVENLKEFKRWMFSFAQLLGPNHDVSSSSPEINEAKWTTLTVWVLKWSSKRRRWMSAVLLRNPKRYVIPYTPCFLEALLAIFVHVWQCLTTASCCT